jgi:hypothetical protein
MLPHLSIRKNGRAANPCTLAHCVVAFVMVLGLVLQGMGCASGCSRSDMGRGGLSDEEVLRLAWDHATKEGYSPLLYQAEIVRKLPRERIVLFTNESATGFGGHFFVFVNTQTKVTSVQPGR